MADHRKREDDLLDDRARQVAKKVAAEAESFMACMLLKDWQQAYSIHDKVDRQSAMRRVDIETQVFLESLETSDGAGAQGEGASVPSEQTA